MTPSRPSVCLAISSFRNDESVIRLLEKALAAEASPFAEVLVVDSLGTGRIASEVAARGWGTRVKYFDHARNLGSAGNLARRLELGAERGHAWVYALNHDGELGVEVVRALIDCGEALERPGAIYPLRYKVGRKSYDVTGRQALPLPFRGAPRPPTEPVIDVYWGSSNGTLYATAPIREGVVPWADLWMAWEDFGYGWALHRRGFRQVVLTTVQTRDHYEYVSKERFGRTVTVIDKPDWYAYYQVRNLILITRRNRQSLLHWLTIAGRIGLEVGITTAVRPRKMLRYGLLARGVVDGIRNRAGKWRLPAGPATETNA
jgi:GT2 family glycosyltransferase